MAGSSGGPDLSKCFGHYRQQTITYALRHCLECNKLKACVRAAWGIDQPRRARRSAWDGGEARGRGHRPPWPSSRDLMAT